MQKICGALAFLGLVMGLAAGPLLAQATQKSKLVVKETELGKLGTTADTKSLTVSPDSKHVAVLNKKGEKYVVSLDNTPGKEYDWIVASSISFTGDSAHLLYVVQQTRAPAAAAAPAAKPGDKAAAAAENMFVVADGKEGKAYHEILNSALIIGAGPRFAYFAKARPGAAPIVVLDNQDAKEYDQVGNLYFSPDGKRVAYGAESGGKAFFVIDGAPNKEYDKVAGASFVWSPDNKRTSFGAVKDTKILLVVDSKEEGPYDQASAAVFSPDSKRIAYVAQKEGKSFVVVDGKPQKNYDGVAGDTIRFSPDGTQVAYMAIRNEKVKDKDNQEKTVPKLFFVLNEKELRAYDGLVRGSFLFSPDGKKTAYVAVKNQRLVVVIDGYEGKEYEDVRLAQFSPDSQKMAYLGKREGRAYAVTDHAESVGYTSVANLLFSPDGKHMAYVAGRDKSTFMVVDGVEGKVYDGGIVAETIVYSPDGKHLAFEAQRDKQKYIVIDDQETSEYNGTLRGTRMVFDGPAAMHSLVVKDTSIVKLDITIP